MTLTLAQNQQDLLDNYKDGLAKVLNLLKENKLKEAVKEFKGILEKAKAAGVTKVGDWDMKDVLDTINGVLSSGYLDQEDSEIAEFKQQAIGGVQKIIEGGNMDKYKQELEAVIKLLKETKLKAAILKLKGIIESAKKDGVSKVGPWKVSDVLAGLDYLLNSGDLDSFGEEDDEAKYLAKYKQQALDGIQQTIKSGNMDKYKQELEAVVKLLKENKLKDATIKFKGIIEKAQKEGVTQVGPWKISDVIQGVNYALASGELEGAK